MLYGTQRLVCGKTFEQSGFLPKFSASKNIQDNYICAVHNTSGLHVTSRFSVLLQKMSKRLLEARKLFAFFWMVQYCLQHGSYIWVISAFLLRSGDIKSGERLLHHVISQTLLPLHKQHLSQCRLIH